MKRTVVAGLAVVVLAGFGSTGTGGSGGRAATGTVGFIALTQLEKKRHRPVGTSL